MDRWIWREDAAHEKNWQEDAAHEKNCIMTDGRMLRMNILSIISGRMLRMDKNHYEKQNKKCPSVDLFLQ